MTHKINVRRITYFAVLSILLILTAVFCIVFIKIQPSAQAASSVFKKGNGTAESPFEVSTVEEFYAISTKLDAYYVQTANIDFTDREFYSIGDYSHPFKGHYDGNKFKLSGISAGFDSVDYTGVFAFIYFGAVVKNVRVENSQFTGRQNVGAVAGLNAGTIEDSFANAVTTVTANSGGGIAGANSGLISRCVNAGEIEVANNYAGGICGINSGEINDSYNKGIINAHMYAGGIAGINNGGNAVIERTFNVGDVIANASANIVGDNMKGTIKQSRFVDGGNLKKAYAFNSGTIYSSIARPQSEFKSGRAFNDWQSFDDNFMFVPSVDHPILKSEYIEVAQIEFEHGTSIKLKPGESISFNARVLPEHASVQDVTLSIESGAEYCSIKDGVISLADNAEAGEYIIVKGQAENAIGVFTIEIIPIRVEKISIDTKDGNATVAPGGSLDFYTTVYPSNASIKDVRYIASSPFADIDAYGKMKLSLDTPIGLEITVTASSYDNMQIEDTFKIKVVEAQVKSVEVTNKSRKFKVTQSLPLSGVAVTEIATTETVDFEIIKEGTTALGARIINGVLYADMPGNIIVIAKYAQSISSPVLFVAQEEPITNIVFRNDNSFAVNGALNLIVETKPENATYSDVAFSIVGNNNVGAKLTGNVLTAEFAGMVTVKAEALGGAYSTQTIYVRSQGDNTVKITDIYLEKDSFTISRSLTLIPVIEPKNAQATVFFEIFNDGGTGVELKDGKLINAQKEGLIILRAYTSDYQTYISVDALKVEVEDVYFVNANRFKVTKGLELAVATNPSNPTYSDVEFEIVSSTADAANINGTFLTAKSVGQVNLRAWVDGVSSKEFVVFVDKEPVTDVKFTSNKKSFKHTESLYLDAMAFPMQATFKDIEFCIDENLTDKQIGAKIQNNILTAEKPGTVIISMKCDEKVYPVVIAVEKEPVIAVSSLRTNLLTTNVGETIFRTSGILELSALLYPDNATNKNLKISITNADKTGAFLMKSIGEFEAINETEQYEVLTVCAGENVYLAAQNPGDIDITVVPLDNPNVESKYTIDVEEEPVAKIYFCLDETAKSNAVSEMKEEVITLQSFGDYYQFDKMFVKANQSGSSSSSLNFSVFTYAENEDIEPTFNGQFKLYYYLNEDDCKNKRNAIDITQIIDGSKAASSNDYITRTAPNLLCIGTRKKVVWVVAESIAGKDYNKVESQPLMLTIYPTNIADIKSLKFDSKTGILSSNNTNKIEDMSGYEISVSFSSKGQDYGFTQYIPTNYTKLGLKIFKYSLSSIQVSVKMIFDAEDPINRFEYKVPITFEGIQLTPIKQLVEEQLNEAYCNYVVFYDLSISNLNASIGKIFNSNVKYVYLYGLTSITHKNLNFTFNNGTSPIGMTLHNINFIASINKDAIRINGTGKLDLNVVGEKVYVQGGKGLDGKAGADGKDISPIRASNGADGLNGDANWNPGGSIPHGQPGADGCDGLDGNPGERGEDGQPGRYGIKLANDNNLDIKVNCYDFIIKGGQGGNGGNGGDGSHGQNGGHGGDGGDGSYKYIVVGWRAGHGGNGGNGGDGGDGGRAGDGGNRGEGGVAINADKVPSIHKVIGDKGAKAGTAGTPGSGGSRGLGGFGGMGYKATTNRVDGEKGGNGYYGSKGAEGNDGI